MAEAQESGSIIAFFRKNVRLINRSVHDLKENYMTYVRQNPEMVTQMEKTTKALSYALEFIPRDYENSVFLSELLNSANSLFVYFNDCILKRSVKFFVRESPNLVCLLERWLSILGYTQAFIEMSASRIGGRRAKWAVIIVISLLKATMKLVLLHWFKSGIQTHPIVKPLKREVLFADGDSSIDSKSTKPFVYVGKRTGHAMRTLAHTPPLHSRTWDAPDPTSIPFDIIDNGKDSDIRETPTSLSRLENVGETLHIIRPLVHLVGVGFFGTESIIPWITSLITDASSHTLLSGQVKDGQKVVRFNNTERRELKRRALIMMFYLLRSPVYDRYTKTRILKLLNFLSDHVPLVRFVLQPLARYLPLWQQVYFYAWNE